jgi:type I restriction enzyme, S subunit
MAKLKRVASLRAGDSIASDAVEPSGDYPVFGGNGLRGYTSSYTHDGTFPLVGRQGALCGNVNYATGRFWASEHAIVVTPLKGNNFFWLGELLRSMNLNQYSQSAAQPGLSVELVEQLEIPVPPLSTQRMIADYLDRETERIDALIAAKRRMVELLEERTWTAFGERVAESQPPSVPLRRVLHSLIDGPFGSAFSSSDYTTVGAVVIRLGNIGFGRYRDADEARIPLEMFETFRHYQVKQGDLIMAGLGDERNHAGRACVAPDLGAAIVKGKCFRGRVNPDRANVEFLALLLSSPMGARAMNVSGRGSTRSMINLEIVKDTEVPLPERHKQDSIVTSMRKDQAQTAKLTGILAKQLDLLHEHRQALITAAVTGQLDVLDAA